MRNTYIILLLALIPLTIGIANAVDFTITRDVGDTSNSILVENSDGTDQFWIDSDGYVYSNATKIRINTLTCSGTDKFSAWDNSTGLFSCSADDSSGSPASIHLIGNVTSVGCAVDEILKVNSTGFFSCAADAGVPDDIHLIGNVTTTGCATGQILEVSGSSWVCGNDDTGAGGTITGDGISGRIALWNGTNTINSTANLSYNIGSGDISLNLENLNNVTDVGCASGQIIKVSGSSWGCADDSGSGSPTATYDFIIYQDGSDTVSISSNGTEQDRDTDDDSVIQDAMNHLPDNGGIVYITSGDYTIDSTIEFNAHGQRVIGAGALATQLNFEGTAVDPVFTMSDSTQRVNLEIGHLRLNQTQDWDIDGTGINMTKFALSHLHDLRIDNVDIGIDLHGIQTYYNMLENIDIFYVDDYGIKIDKTSNENTLSRVRIAPETTATGVFVDNSNGIDMFFVDVENGVAGAAVGIDIGADAHGANIISTYLDNNTINLRLATDVEGIIVTGKISGGISENIDDNGCVHCTITAWVEFEPYGDTVMAYKRATTVSVSSNSVTAKSCFIQIDTSSAPQTVDEVNGLVDGCLVIIKTNSGSNSLTLTEGGSSTIDFQLAGSADVTLSASQDFFLGFYYEGVGIFEIARAENN